MNQKNRHVFAACAIGVLIGSWVTLNSTTWWIGGIAGGLIGYVAYDLKHSLNVVMATCKRLKQAWFREKSELNRSQNRLWFAAAVQVWLGLASVFLTVACGMVFLAFACLVQLEEVDLLLATWRMLPPLGVIIGGLVVAATIFAPILTSHIVGRATYQESKHAYWKDIVQAKRFQSFNPVTVLFCHIPGVFSFIIEIIEVIILEIHCHERLICALHAALWTVISHITGNGLIGLLAAGVVGVWHCEVASILQRKPAHS